MPIREYFCQYCEFPFDFVTYKLADENVHPEACPNCCAEEGFERIMAGSSFYFKGMLEQHGGKEWGDFPPIPPGDDRRHKPTGFRYKKII